MQNHFDVDEEGLIHFDSRISRSRKKTLGSIAWNRLFWSPLATYQPRLVSHGYGYWLKPLCSTLTTKRQRTLFSIFPHLSSKRCWLPFTLSPSTSSRFQLAFHLPLACGFHSWPCLAVSICLCLHTLQCPRKKTYIIYRHTPPRELC